MLIGEVSGSVWATKKCEELNGYKLLVVKTDNKNIVAIDTIGAGEGDTVLVCTGSSARLIAENAPIDAAITGIIDTVKNA